MNESPNGEPVAPAPPDLAGPSPTVATSSPLHRDDVEYYSIDSRVVGWREYLFETKNPVALLAVLIVKTFRIRLSGSSDDPSVGRLEPFEVERAAIPVDEGFVDASKLSIELERLGFIDPIAHFISTPLQSTTHMMLTYRHPDKPVIARAHARVFRFKHPPKVKAFVEYLTAFDDGTFVWSQSNKADTIEPDAVGWKRSPNARPDELLAEHCARVAARKVVSPVSIDDASAMRAVFERHHALVVEFQKHRGFFTTPSAKELESLHRAFAPAATTGVDRDAELPVLLEVDKQLNNRASWQSAFVLFAVSLLMFIALGARSWGWEFLLILLPALFFHELGHYLAMWGFGYRNVRMFFLPLMGAAVMGRGFNVPAWKQVVVALAGPVPGILAAVAFGLLGVTLQNSLLTQIALVLLLLNGFNLLPMLPLDGGRVAHVLLFRRHPTLDVGFRVIALLGLLGLGIVAHDRVLIPFAVLLALSIPMAWRTARVTSQLQRRLTTPIAMTAGPDRIPVETAREIIGSLKAASRRPVANKILANQTLDVFESIATPPPSWITTLGLGLVHITSLVIVVVASVAFVVLEARNSGFDPLGLRVFDRAARLEEFGHPLEMSKVRYSTNAYVEQADHEAIMGVFKDDAKASAFYQSRADNLGQDGAILLAAHVVLLEISKGDKSRRDAAVLAFQRAAAEPTVSRSGITNFTIVGTAPSPEIALALHAEIGSDAYGGPGLIAPWQTDDSRTAAERAAHLRARKTELHLSTVQRSANEGRDERPRRKKINELRRLGKDEEALAIERDVEREYRERLIQMIEPLRNDETLDPTYIDAWLEAYHPSVEQQLRTEDDYEKMGARMSALHARLGVIDADPATASPASTRPHRRASSGAEWVMHEGSVLQVGVRDQSMALKLPRVLAWLNERVVKLRIDVNAQPDSDVELD